MEPDIVAFLEQFLESDFVWDEAGLADGNAYSRALEVLEKGLVQNPNLASARMLLAELLENATNFSPPGRVSDWTAPWSPRFASASASPGRGPKPARQSRRSACSRPNGPL